MNELVLSRCQTAANNVATVVEFYVRLERRTAFYLQRLNTLPLGMDYPVVIPRMQVH